MNTYCRAIGTSCSCCCQVWNDFEASNFYITPEFNSTNPIFHMLQYSNSRYLSHSNYDPCRTDLNIHISSGPSPHVLWHYHHVGRSMLLHWSTLYPIYKNNSVWCCKLLFPGNTAQGTPHHHYSYSIYLSLVALSNALCRPTNRDLNLVDYFVI